MLSLDIIYMGPYIYIYLYVNVLMRGMCCVSSFNPLSERELATQKTDFSDLSLGENKFFPDRIFNFFSILVIEMGHCRHAPPHLTVHLPSPKPSFYPLRCLKNGNFLPNRY